MWDARQDHHHEGNEIEKRYYSVESLTDELRVFEQRYGVESEAFYDAHVTRQPIEGVDCFDRAVWVDAYEEVDRLLSEARHPSAFQPAG